jgi:glutaredoxin
MTPSVVLYGRDGCCLCDDARAVLLRAQGQFEFDLQERDIEADDALLREYLERIPVVTIDGAPVFELFVNEAELFTALARFQSPERHQ